MEEPPQPRRQWHLLGPFLIVAILASPALAQMHPLFLFAPLAVVMFLIGRDYLVPCYRDPRFPQAVRKKRVLKLVCRILKWGATIITMISSLMIAIRWTAGYRYLNDLYYLALLALVAAALWWVDHCVKQPEPIGRCQTCGYDLTDNVSGRCPECGTPVPPPE